MKLEIATLAGSSYIVIDLLSSEFVASQREVLNNEDGISLNIRLSHQEMACIIGSTRETVTVVLGQLQKEDLLKISRRRVVITDLGRLSAEVNESTPQMADPRMGRATFMPHLSGSNL